METIERAYNYVFYERADARVKDWLFTSSPVQIAVILTGYYVLIKLVLPAYMRDRKPYNLKSIIKWYNIVQIISNSIVSWGLLTSGWTTKYHYGCILPDYTMDPEAVRLLSYMWWTIVLKLMELIETVFFILRKREKQASFLHVYHHISTVIIIWTAVKYAGGGTASFVPLVNTGVHVIMYTYYLFSSEGSPGVKAFLSKHKKWLTITQMVQFIVIIVFTFPVMLPSCEVTKVLKYMNYINVFFVLFLFYKFYKKTYVKKEHSKEEHNGTNKKN